MSPAFLAQPLPSMVLTPDQNHSDATSAVEGVGDGRCLSSVYLPAPISKGFKTIEKPDGLCNVRNRILDAGMHICNLLSCSSSPAPLEIGTVTCGVGDLMELVLWCHSSWY